MPLRDGKALVLVHHESGAYSIAFHEQSTVRELGPVMDTLRDIHLVAVSMAQALEELAGMKVRVWAGKSIPPDDAARYDLTTWPLEEWHI